MSDANATPLPEISDEAIAKRAYEIWESRGCPEGEGDADWITAKAALEAEAQQAREAQQGRGRGVLLRLYDRWRQRAAL